MSARISFPAPIVSFAAGIGVSAALLLLVSAPGAALEDDARAGQWAVHGEVHAAEVVGDTLYVGGEFTAAGVPVGQLAVLNTANESLAQPAANVLGDVYAVVPDGAGGWYAAGDIVRAGDQVRQGIARVLADGTVDPDFSPSFNGRVDALARRGDDLYVGGLFTLANGLPRSNLALVHAQTGALQAWDPGPNGRVHDLLLDGDTLYAAGAFSVVGVMGRARLAAFDLDNNGTLLPLSVAIVGDAVHALALAGTSLYLGGEFQTVGGSARANLAAVHPATGALQTWAPAANGPVHALLAEDDWVYAGGGFSTLNGSSQRMLAKILRSNGTAVAGWGANIGQEVRALALNGGLLYAGGAFTSVNSQPRRRLAVFDTQDGSLDRYNPSMSGTVHALHANKNQLAVGGAFLLRSAVPRSNLAAFDLSTGAAISWTPQTNGLVRALARFEDRLFVGGDFTSVSGNGRDGLAALNLASGAVGPWAPECFPVHALLIHGDTLYVGGNGVWDLGGEGQRENLAAVDASSLEVLPFAPEVNGLVRALAKSGDFLYIGGDFTQVDSLTRNRLAAFSATGDLLSWNPGVGGQVSALAASEDHIYVGGNFLQAGGFNRERLAAFSHVGNLSTWTPGASGHVRTLAVLHDRLYVGGGFTQIGGQARERAAAFGVASGNLLSWEPRLLPGDVHVLVPGADFVAAGGSFLSATGVARPGLALFDKDAEEICDDGVDNTGNGLVDCADPACHGTGACFDEICGTPGPDSGSFGKCPNGAMVSWRPAPGGSSDAGVFGSDVDADSIRFQVVSDMNRSIRTLRWWGYFRKNTLVCQPSVQTFRIAFNLAAAGFPGDLVSEQVVSATVRGTGHVHGSGEVMEFEATLPEAVSMPHGFISIALTGDPDCDFFWFRTDEGPLGHVRFQSTGGFSGGLGGFGLCLLPCTIEGDGGEEGEGEGVSEGDGEGEGTPEGEGLPEGEGSAEGEPGTEGEGALEGEGAEGEGETEGGDFPCGAEGPGDGTFASCAAGAMVNRRPVAVDHVQAGFIGSDLLLNDGRFQSFSGADAPIVSLRWWGTEYFSAAPCVRTPNNFRIVFLDDDAGGPGAVVSEQVVTPTMVDTGVFATLANSVKQYEANLPAPVNLETGWLGIVGIDNDNCAFYWYRSDQGVGVHQVLNGENFSMGVGNFSFCHMPCPLAAEAEGEGEGLPEGEGAAEGFPEGEGGIEGLPEGEGLVEGEGSIEGMPEGEGLVEGEGSIEGMPEGEGLVEGEGSAEGVLEGEADCGSEVTGTGTFAFCPAGAAVSRRPEPIGTSQTGLYGSDLLLDSFRLERFDGVTEPIVAMRWWGTDFFPVSPCSRADVFRISFYLDDNGAVGEAVSVQFVTAASLATGLTTGPFGTPVNQYDVSLPVPVSLASGWLSIVGTDDSDCAFYWYRSDEGSGTHQRLEDDEFALGAGNLSYCLMPCPIGGSTAEGEVPEGETTEGETPEGETTEGEVPEGETTEGETTEGEHSVARPHSADQDGNGAISLSELLRVIQFFNSGGLHCAVAPVVSEDGYLPGLDASLRACAPHDSDYNPQDWQISLSELLRLIQFFNVGGYFYCPDNPGSEDGYCPGQP